VLCFIQLDGCRDPLELLAESCKRICPTSVKPMSTKTRASSSSNHTATTTTSSTTTTTGGGSETSRRLEHHEGPSNDEDAVADAHSIANDAGTLFDTDYLTATEERKKEQEARTADRTASQHLWGSHDVIGHVTIRYSMSFPIGGPLERSLYLQPFSRLRSKRIGVTSLTFQCHVTSTVT